MNLLDITTEEVINVVCECSKSTIDWSQFWPSMIATFVGFVLALISAFITSVVSKKFKIQHLKNRVILELAKIYKDIKENDKSLLTYDCPIWDSIISSSLLLDIGDNEFILELSSLYGQIKILEQCECKYLNESSESMIPDKKVLFKRATTANKIENSKYYSRIQKAKSELDKKKLSEH